MITGKTSVVGIIGDPLEHSLSPPMHNAAFKHLELDYVYVPFPVKPDQLPAAISGARAMGIKGLNVTIPHKTEVIPYLDRLDKAAELIGAVNTIKFGEDGVEGKEVKGHNGNGAKGYNTNGLGAVAAIEEVAVVKNNKVVILGAGGASRAVSFQILLNGAGKLIIANRTPEKALVLKENLDTKLGRDVSCTDLGEGLKEELKDADILINTTPIGMHPNVGQEPLVKADMMPEGLVVNDIIYNPLETSLLREARKAGATPVSGTKMLIYQGMEAFRIWTGIKPPFEVFEAALMKELNPA